MGWGMVGGTVSQQRAHVAGWERAGSVAIPELVQSTLLTVMATARAVCKLCRCKSDGGRKSPWRPPSFSCGPGAFCTAAQMTTMSTPQATPEQGPGSTQQTTELYGLGRAGQGVKGHTWTFHMSQTNPLCLPVFASGKPLHREARGSPKPTSRGVGLAKCIAVRCAPAYTSARGQGRQ